MSKTPGSQTLPPKELSIFKKVVKYYDQKQYKNGLKYAKQILANPKYAEHGETLAMKGILLHCLGKKEEARDCVKRGVLANLSSFVCWHIYGLIQKSDRNYEEAIKCYSKALSLDSTNLQVLRDLSVLQMQLRDYEGCKKIRYELLRLRPNQRASWIGYAMIHHLLGNYDTALTVLSEFRKCQGDATPGYETSELILYQINIMIEAGMFEGALSLLDESKSQIVDVNSFLEMRAQLLIKSGKTEEAQKCCWDLIDRNHENRQYFELLCQSNSSSDPARSSDPAALNSTLLAILDRYPHSKLANRLILETYSGDKFSHSLDTYLKTHLRKGVPPLFIQLHTLWEDPERLSTLENLVNQYRKNVMAHRSLQCDPIVVESPSTFIWLNFLFAQFLNYSGRHQEALDVIDKQLSTTPTLVDFYVLKADVYSAAGDVITASRWMEEAQSLDTADRFLNARCTRLMVQACRSEDAVAMASKFTRGTTSAAEYLSEMQCMWFLLENARTLRDLQKYGESLKLCHEIEHHYRNILDDQLDFHSYCLRKGTLRAYVDTLRLEDRLRDHPSYLEATQLAVEIYLHLYVKPMGAGDDSVENDKDKMNSSEAKKLRNKQRKAAKRAEAEAARVRAEQERREQAVRSRQPASENTENEHKSNQDSGLDPYALARPADPLEEACKFIRPLLHLSPKRVEAHCLAYEVYERKNKWLLMYRAIKHGMDIPGSADQPWFHECCVRFLCKLAQYRHELQAQPDTHVHRILLTHLPDLFPEWSLVESCQSIPSAFNHSFRTRNASSFPHVFRATLLQCLIEPDKRSDYLSALPSPSDGLDQTTWQTCADSLRLLRNAYVGPIGEIPASIIEGFRLACARSFPMANAFLTETELNNLRAAMRKAAADTAVCGLYTSFVEAEVDDLSSPPAPSTKADQLADHVATKLTVSHPATMVNGDGADRLLGEAYKTNSKTAVRSSDNTVTADSIPFSL